MKPFISLIKSTTRKEIDVNFNNATFPFGVSLKNVEGTSSVGSSHNGSTLLNDTHKDDKYSTH
jgi:hypothetical protein